MAGFIYISITGQHMASTAAEAINHFINARGFREGEHLPSRPCRSDIRIKTSCSPFWTKMGDEGLIENVPAGPYKMTKAGYVKFFGEPPSEDDTIKAIMSEIATRGIKVGKSFIWAPCGKPGSQALSRRRSQTGLGKNMQ